MPPNTRKVKEKAIRFALSKKPISFIVETPNQTKTIKRIPPIIINGIPIILSEVFNDKSSTFSAIVK